MFVVVSLEMARRGRSPLAASRRRSGRHVWSGLGLLKVNTPLAARSVRLFWSIALRGRYTGLRPRVGTGHLSSGWAAYGPDTRESSRTPSGASRRGVVATTLRSVHALHPALARTSGYPARRCGRSCAGGVHSDRPRARRIQSLGASGRVPALGPHNRAEPAARLLACEADGPGSRDGQDLDGLEGPESPLSLIWDREHDQFLVRRLMELIAPSLPRPPGERSTVRFSTTCRPRRSPRSWPFRSMPR